MPSYKNYEKTRLAFNNERKLVWSEISGHLQRFINPKASVLDIGSGYCDFINSIKAGKKYALDKYMNPKNYASKDVKPIYGDFSAIEKVIPNNSLDVVFASNFFEHLTDKEMEKCISLIKKKMNKSALLIIIQPNYRLCYKNYFDDYTHVKVWSDASLSDFLKSKGFQIRYAKPGFLPFSMKSRLPKSRLLVRMYLNSPLKPFAGQMLLIAGLKTDINQ